MTGRQRRKWLGLAALRLDGRICLICVTPCGPALTLHYLQSCRAFDPCMDWKDAATGLCEKDAEMAYRQALTEHLAEMRAVETAKQAEE